MQNKVLTSILGSVASLALVFGCDSDDSGSGASPDSASGEATGVAPGPVNDDPTEGGDDSMTGVDPAEGDDTEDDDVPFIDPESSGGGVSIECSLWDQDCEVGQKCASWANDGGSSWNATKCVPVEPSPGQPGDTCTVEGSGLSGVDSCDVSSMCWDTDPETGEGNCVAFCSGSESAPACDDPLATCLIGNDGALILCLPTCDPLLQNCEADNACYPNGDTDEFLCAPNASGADGGNDNSPCEFANACNPGTVCLNAEFVDGCPSGTGGCCQNFCDLSDPESAAEACTENEVCEPWFEEGATPPGFEDVGVCALP